MIKNILNYIIFHRLQLTKFVVVGLIACSIYFSSFYLFYSVSGLDYRVASSISYVLTLICHFLLHRIFTFKAMQLNVTSAGWRYLLMLAVNYLIMLTVVWCSTSFLKLSPYIGLFFSMCITANISFFSMKYFVFATQYHSKPSLNTI